MKSATGKTKKQRTADAAKASKPTCGTLSYLAECRGTPQKAETFRHQGPPADFTNRIVRKYPAES